MNCTRVKESNNTKIVDRYFDELSEKWNEKYHTSRFFQQRVSVIISLMDRYCTKARNTLDYGCGTGLFSEAMARRFESVVAVDRSPKMREKTQSVLACYPNATVATPDQIVGMHFDFILCSSVIEYIDNDLEFLACLGKLLNPKGTLLISFPHRWGPIQMLNRFIFQWFNNDCYTHFQQHTYTKRSIRQMAQNVGLVCVDVVSEIGLSFFPKLNMGEQIFAILVKP